MTPLPQPASIEPRGRRLLGRCELGLFIVLLLAQLLPIWCFKYVPTQDGPEHLQNARIIRDLVWSDTAPAAAVERKYLRINPRPVPNWFGHAALALLMLAAPPLLAEKLLLSVYLLLTPLCVRYALGAIRPGSEFLAVLALPLVYTSTFQMGFYNFSFSLAFAILTLGFWIAHHRDLGPARAAVLLLLGVLLYFSHLFSFMVVVLALGLLMVWTFLFHRSRRGPERHDAAATLWRQMLWTGAAFAPVLALVGLMLLPHLRHAGQFERPAPAAGQAIGQAAGVILEEEAPAGTSRPIRIVHRLTHFNSFISEPSQIWISTVLLWTFLLTGLYAAVGKLRRRELHPWDGLLLVLAAYAVIYFICRGGVWRQLYTEPRMLVTIFFVAVLWMGVYSYRPPMRLAIQAGALVVVLAYLTTNLQRYARLNEALTQYVSAADHMQRGSVFLPICFAPAGWDANGQPLSPQIGIFDHASGYIALAADSVSLRNYEALEDYFPTMYQPRLNPGPTLLADGYDILGYPRQTGGRIDYVLLSYLRDEERSAPQTQAILRQLDQAYDRIYPIYPSQDRIVQLYKRKDSAK